MREILNKPPFDEFGIEAWRTREREWRERVMVVMRAHNCTRQELNHVEIIGLFPLHRALHGNEMIAVSPVFRRFLRELSRDPDALYQLDPRQFEELIAGPYEEAGCEKVILTPRSGDRGRDVFATSHQFGTIRILDQVKLYSPHRVVEADDVRALYGVLSLDRGHRRASSRRRLLLHPMSMRNSNP